MPRHLQTFLAGATQKSADALVAALLNLPPDKRSWSAGGRARTAAHQVAECVVINSGVADAITNPSAAANYDMGGFNDAVAAIAAKEDALPTLLEESAKRLVAAIDTVASEDLDTEIQLPWGKWTISHLIAHPYWNMAYHEGQINFIATLLES